MNPNRIIKLLTPNNRVYLWIICAFVIILFTQNIALGGISLLVLMYLVYYNWHSTRDRNRKWMMYIDSLSSEIDTASRYALLNVPIPLCLVDFDGNLTWYNSRFSELMELREALDQNLTGMVPGIDLERLIEDRNFEQELRVGDRVFRVLSNLIKMDDPKHSDQFILMLYWLDVSHYSQLKSIYTDEKPLIALVQVDNYDDVMNETKEDKRPFVISEIDRRINLWASRMNGLIKKFQNDRYLVIFENRYLETLEGKRFSILDEVREIEAGNRIPVTLSIGVGTMAKGLSQLEEHAFSALELALGRGGDQAVVRKSGGFDFYGGKTKAVEKRNRVKARIIAHAFRPIIDESSEVFIMGHRYPDMDSFGAAVGVYRAVINRGKDAHIVLDEVNEAIKSIYVKFQDNGTYSFLTGQQAKERFGEKDLLVVVDTHRPSFTECPELLTMSSRVVVFDHHRRGTEIIENTLLKYMEPYASSTSELVSEMIQYMENRVKIDKIEAEALLAGITVDTKNFSIKTGVRTFEAAAFLRRYEADTAVVRQLFQDDLSTFVAKSNVVSGAQIYRDELAISVCREEMENIRMVAAQGADALLNIRGITCSFVVGRKADGTTFISGRSMGDINVQIILEKIGGGGHLTVAGAQFFDMELDEVVTKLKKAIDDYLAEGE